MNGARFGVTMCRVAGFCERGNEPLGFLKAKEIYLLNKGSVVKRLCLVCGSLNPTYFQVGYEHI
jgi:hypothetical protein